MILELLVVVDSVFLLVLVLVGVALFTVIERKALSSMQLSAGPNQLGWFGSLQAIGDGVNLIVKAFTLPEGSDSFLFVGGPIIAFSVGVSLWGLVPVCGSVLVDSGVSLVIILAISSIGIHGVLMGGYSSNSKYAYYGGVRSGAQMISYEVSLAFIIGCLALMEGGDFCLGSWNSLVGTGCMLACWPLLVCWLISILAETNSHPFDLPEAESELVSGYNVEYSGGSFALYFLGEYSSILLMCWLTSLIFFSQSVLGVILCMSFFVWSRSAWPSVSYDQLMFLGWWCILPVVTGLLLFLLSVVV